MEVELNGRTIDLRRAFPLLIEDWETLETQYGLTAERLNKGSVVDASIVVFHCLQKADATVTRDEVRKLTLDHPAVQAVLDMLKKPEAPKGPSSASSTSSDQNTGGPSGTSCN